MKKTIISVIITTCMMTIFSYVLVVEINNRYEEELQKVTSAYETEISGMKTELDELKNEYENLQTLNCNLESKNYNTNKEVDKIQSKYDELQSDMDELESEVFKMMNGDEYSFSLRLDDETHMYSYSKDGLFGQKSHGVMKILGIN